MKITKIGLIACTLMLASCSTIRHTSDVAPVETKVVSLSIADLEISPKKVSRSTTWEYDLFKRPDVTTIKKNTEAMLLDEAGADILVEPQYIVERYGFLRGGKVTVIGFPAKIKGFHKMTPAEAEMVEKAGRGNCIATRHHRWLPRF